MNFFCPKFLNHVFHTDSFLSLNICNYQCLFPNWQKESWQTFEETSGYVRPERVNKWANSVTDFFMMMTDKPYN